MTITAVHLDYETFSEADLIKCGHLFYATHPSTRVLMCSYWFEYEGAPRDLESVKLWDAAMGEAMPDDLRAALLNPKILKWAHNAAFEIAITKYVLKLPVRLTEWRCTSVLALTLSLPAALGQLCDVINIPADAAKVKDGKRLIKKFCCPRKPTKKNPSVRVLPEHDPEDWQRFRHYGRVDTLAELSVYFKLIKYGPPDHEWRLWALDQKINHRGLPIDLELVRGVLAIDEAYKRHATAEAQQLTGLHNPNSPSQLLPYLQACGYPYIDMKKANVTKAVKTIDEWCREWRADWTREQHVDHVRRVMVLRQRLSMTSIAKFKALEKATCADGRLRGVFQFAGAGRTWRWAGRIFQPQNLARGIFKNAHQIRGAIEAAKTGSFAFMDTVYGVDAIPSVLSSLCRSAVVASGPGRTLSICDLASIEAVMLAWAARSKDKLEKFRAGIDTYKAFATELFGVAYEDVTKAQRTYSKPPELGCGYMLGAKGLVAYADGMGVTMTEAEAQHAVDVYRSTNPEVVRFWWDLDKAMRETITTGRPHAVGKFVFRMRPPFLQIHLPSGRCLSYLRPEIQDRETPWGETRPTITYEGLDQYTRKWKRISTHPGKVAENIVQAISRDVLAEGLVNADAADLDIILHVHDEIGADTDDDPEQGVLLRQSMTRIPAWCADAPISAAGFQSPFYMKD